MRQRGKPGRLVAMVVFLAVTIPRTAAASAPNALPDLNSYGLSYQLSGCAFTMVAAHALNEGDADASSFVVGARMDGRRYGKATYDQILAPGEEVWIYGTWPTIVLSEGIHLLDTFLDARREVQESEESDNLDRWSITCP
jgi:subtilase family serine protease